MIHLLLAIASSMSVSVVMRLSEGRVRGGSGMLAVNYLMCTLLSALYMRQTPAPLSAEGSGFAIALGTLNGFLYLGSFMLLQWNVKKNGVVLPATFMKLGVLVPTAMSVAFFHETPTLAQVAGFAMAIAAIVMISAPRGERQAASGLGLVLLLIGGGMTDATSKIYEELGQSAHENRFLLCTFLVALLLCTALCIAKRRGLTPVDAAFGLLIGIPNYFSARFLLLSLASVPAVVAYPTYSVGTIVLVTLIGAAVFGERLSRRQSVAMGIILASLVLLNL